MDLTTTYLGLTLAHPVVASAGPLTGGIDGVRALADGGAAAIVHTLFAGVGEAGGLPRFARFVGLDARLGAHLFDEYEAQHPLRVASLQAHLKAPAIARPALIVHDLGGGQAAYT